jgi:serine/threonine protein phosphatase PrpC
MRYVAIAESDIGIGKKANQDSVLMKHAICGSHEVLMAVICDGMGGLSKGELASATVVRAFDEWFTKELSRELENFDIDVIGEKWFLMLKELNSRIREYGQEYGERLGTTFTGVLFVNGQLVAVHVGDTRLYHIAGVVRQITEDHTYVAREVLNGRLTSEQARTDKHRHALLQCVGASKIIEPQIVCEEVEQGVYMICSDGFRNRMGENELAESFVMNKIKNEKQMRTKVGQLIKAVRRRGEKDDISVILIKVKKDATMTSWKNMKGMLRERKKSVLLGGAFLVVGAVMLFWGILCI